MNSAKRLVNFSSPFSNGICRRFLGWFSLSLLKLLQPRHGDQAFFRKSSWQSSEMPSQHSPMMKPHGQSGFPWMKPSDSKKGPHLVVGLLLGSRCCCRAFQAFPGCYSSLDLRQTNTLQILPAGCTSGFLMFIGVYGDIANFRPFPFSTPKTCGSTIIVIIIIIIIIVSSLFSKDRHFKEL